MNRLRNLLAIVLALQSMATAADGWEMSGHLSAQTRHFTESARWPGQRAQPGHLALEAVAELRWKSADGDRRASIMPVLRWDRGDGERSLVDLREAYWARRFGDAELLLGINTVFWGVTESLHLVDIVNQTDAVADVDGETKLGQPMANLALQTDWGLVSVYLMPHFRQRTFAGREGRLRPPLPVDGDRAQYEAANGRRHMDLAIRYSHYFGDVDIGLSLFHGTSREPRLLPDASGRHLLPHYDQITQAGLDLQLTRGAWLWKLEAIVRDGHAETFAAAVGGFEYTLYQVSDSAADLGLLLEYQYDGRGDDEPPALGDNDLFAGLRLALNDVQDTTLLAGIGYDLKTSAAVLNVEAERRIGNDLALELRARMFDASGRDSALNVLDRDDYLELRLSWHF